MNFKIHRGSDEIGGSCVEVWTTNTRILIDLGMPLMKKDDSEFNFNNYKKLDINELLKKGILPDITGLYQDCKPQVDGILISHAHQDHYGLLTYVHPDIPCYIGEASHKIIEISNLFTNQIIDIHKPVYFEREKSFIIGDITITPYWVCHSAFDAYSFLIETSGIRIFYSGDFRAHGRKSKTFKWFLHNAPKDVEYLILEGTSIGNDKKSFKTEEEIEKELIKVFNNGNYPNIIFISSQNIDRIVSIYKACLQTNKTMVVDVYLATILKELSEFAKIPYPSEGFGNLKVIFSYYTSERLSNKGKQDILYQFKNYKITKEEISKNINDLVLLVRTSMEKDLNHIRGIEKGNLIYSMWDGYLKKKNLNNFIEYFKNKSFMINHIHTSGHADIETLKQFVDAINPKNIVPIHTIHSEDYQNIFNQKIITNI